LLKIKTDLEEIRDLALDEGASRAKVIDTSSIVVDERVQLKCRYPPCINYGRSLMCPPYTLTAKEFREILGKYKYAIIFQVDKTIDKEIQKYIKNKETTLLDLYNDEKFVELVLKKGAWNGGVETNKIISALEREAFKRGYYFALGFTSGPCRLCESCDTKSPCKHPWEARPSMEAVGIDVSKTAENAGFKIQWGTKESMNLTALVLID
jgi:predicted metal-binding protein